MSHRCLFAGLVLLAQIGIAPGVSASAGPVLFVDEAAQGPKHDGETWDSAFRHLQDALAVADEGISEIHVAQGCYRPDENEANLPGTDDPRRESFFLVDGVALYGGFPPGGGDFDERDPELYKTILSGDLAEDDRDDFANNDENSYHVVRGMDLIDPGTILDGFTVVGGNADGPNDLDDAGGGIRVDGGANAPIFRNCLVEGNSGGTPGEKGSGGSGGFRVENGSPILIQCDFIGNTARVAAGLNFLSSSPILVNCRILGNRATIRSGGIGMNFSDPLLINCEFVGNTAVENVGAIGAFQGQITMVNCTLTLNAAPEGAGLWLRGEDASADVRNCILWNNADVFGDAVQSQIFLQGNDVDENNVLVEYSCVQGWDDQFNGAGNFSDDPRLLDADGLDFSQGNDDDDLRLFPGSPCIDAGDNGLVEPDFGDLDGDGDVREATPFDAAGVSRFLDDPMTEDTGQGRRPIVDIGAHEFVPIDAGVPGFRLWTNEKGGRFESPRNWNPAVPTELDAAVFDIGSNYEVTFSRDATTDQLFVISGKVTLILNQQQYFASQELRSVIVGPYAHSNHPDVLRTLRLENGNLLADQIWVCGPGNGVLIIGDEASVEVTSQLRLDGGVLHCGRQTLLADLINLGLVEPGLFGVGTLRIDDAFYRQRGTTEHGVAVTGMLRIEIAGTGDDEYDKLVVTNEDGDGNQFEGLAQLGGVLQVELLDSFVPAKGDVFTVVQAEDFGELFEVAYMPGLPGGDFMRLDYVELEDHEGQHAAVVLVETLSQYTEFGDPESLDIDGGPTDVAVGLLNDDAFIDVAITLTEPGLPGCVLILLNSGVDAKGEWLGFGKTAQIEVGLDPSAVTIADIDGDSLLDLAITNAGDDTVSVLLNTGNGQKYDLVALVDVGDEPSDVLVRDYNDDMLADLAVANEGDNTLLILINQGNAEAFVALQEPIAVGVNPNMLLNLDVDQTKDDPCVDLFVLNGGSDNVVAVTNAGGEEYYAASFFDVGKEPVGMVVADFDLNGEIDVATVNQGDGTVTILLAEDELNFAPGLSLPVGSMPSSIVATDLEGDGDNDLALIVHDDEGNAQLKVLRNDLTEGQLVFTAVEGLGAEDNPTLIIAADLDGDGNPDLLTVSGPPPGGAFPEGPNDAVVTWRFNAIVETTCPWDLDGDGNVGPPDLILLLGSWLDPYDTEDLIRLLGSWGPCP